MTDPTQPAAGVLRHLMCTREVLNVIRMAERLGDPDEAYKTVALGVRAELLGVTVDSTLDHDDWVAAHTRLALPYLREFCGEALNALPLQLGRYPVDLRDDVAFAVANVLDADAAQAPAHQPLYAPSPRPRPLPDQAPRVIGLCGPPRSGKDVTADYIEANYADVHRFAFSDAIRDEANAFLAPFGHEIVEANKSLGRYRHLLQGWGMGRRAEDEHYWTKEVARKVRAAWSDGTRMVIVTGARMPSDVQVITDDLHGEMWRVERPGNDYQYAENASAKVESGLAHLPDSIFRTILNPVEGDLGPYEANIEAALRADR